MGSFICTDLGASSTRYCSDDGIIRWIPNNVCIIDEDTVTRLEPWNANSLEKSVKQSLDLSISKVGGSESEYFPVRALVGDVATRYSTSGIRPNGMMSKHMQQINYISALTALAVNRIVHNVSEDDVDMYIALPPVEAKPAEEYVAKQLVGTFKIKFNMLNTELTLHIKTVTCLAESHMATTSFIFNIDGSLNQQTAKFLTGNLLSIDIGASTTDLAVLQNGQFLEKTGKTYKIGGNLVRDLVAEYIQQEFGYEADNTTAEQAVAEGRVPSGSNYIDFSDFVKRAKEEFAIQVTNNMNTYFTIVGIPLQNFKGVVVSGGGSMSSEYVTDEGETVKTSEPMSYYISERLKAICNGIEVLYIGDEPRLANIKGMFVRAIFEKANKEEK